MKYLVARYLFPYLISVAVAFALWCTSIYFAEGIIPFVMGLIFLLVVFTTLPILMYIDYLSMKQFVINYKKMQKGEIDKHDYYKDLAVQLSDRFGIPEFVAAPIADKIVNKLKKKEQDSKIIDVQVIEIPETQQKNV